MRRVTRYVWDREQQKVVEEGHTKADLVNPQIEWVQPPVTLARFNDIVRLHRQSFAEHAQLATLPR